MIRVRTVLAAILACVLMACGTGAAPSPTPVAQPADAPSVVITPIAASPTRAATSPSPSPSPTPRPTSEVTPVPVPEPTGVTFTTDPVELPGPSGTDTITYTVAHTTSWKAPRTEGVEIRVYGVTKCLARPDNPVVGTHGPCLVEHMQLPPSILSLAAKASSVAGKVRWIEPFSNDCSGIPVGPDARDYLAVVIAAYNPAGHSIFAIAYPGSWFQPGPGDMYCGA